jgi:hypothetical protein
LTTSNFGEGIESKAEVFGKEVSAELLVHTFKYTLKMRVGASQSVVMTGVGNDDIILLERGYVGGLVDGPFKGVKALAIFSGDG